MKKVTKPSSSLGIIINESFDGFIEDDIRELIRRRRRQILIHSCIYYRLGTSIWTDKKYDECSRELVELQAQYPNISKTVEYYEDFKDWDGTTGFNLSPLGDPNILALATQLSSQVRIEGRKIINLKLD